MERSNAASERAGAGRTRTGRATISGKRERGGRKSSPYATRTQCHIRWQLRTLRALHRTIGVATCKSEYGITTTPLFWSCRVRASIHVGRDLDDSGRRFRPLLAAERERKSRDERGERVTRSSLGRSMPPPLLYPKLMVFRRRPKTLPLSLFRVARN